MAAAKGQGGAHGKGHAAHDDDDHGDHGDGGHGGGHCPPPWIITFADMVTLLMAFFVILLQTSKPDTPKFNAFAAVMRQTFGSVPDASGGQGILNGGATILNLNDGPQNGKPEDTPPGNAPKPDGAPGDGAGDGGNGTDGKGGNDKQGKNGTPNSDPNAIAEALKNAMDQGSLTVNGPKGPVVVNLPKDAGPDAAKRLADTLANAMEAALGSSSTTGSGSSGNKPADGQTGQSQGAQAQGGQTDKGQTQPGQAQSGQQTAVGQGDAQGAGANGTGGTGTGGPGQAQRMAEIAQSRLNTALSAAMAEGKVTVGEKDGKVLVTIGAGGAFQSGSSDLTTEANQIIDSLIRTASTSKGTITVTGHTDNVPISGGQYSDNWDLAAARAAAVVRAITEDGRIDPSRLEAVSKGDTAPIADNSTEDGRAKNRRIEIQLDYTGG